MRVTAEVKQRTREAILDAARELFTDKGFEQTTTRDIAKVAKIASGTLFNYFPTKEALAMNLVGDAMVGIDEEFSRRRCGDEAIDESLFLYIIIGLRRLVAIRPFVGLVFEQSMGAFTSQGADSTARDLRRDHLETVADLLVQSGLTADPSTITMHLYWTLYLGVVAFWSRDASPNQEDTLVLLDQSLRLFVGSMHNDPTHAEVNNDT